MAIFGGVKSQEMSNSCEILRNLSSNVTFDNFAKVFDIHCKSFWIHCSAFDVVFAGINYTFAGVSIIIVHPVLFSVMVSPRSID